MTQQTVDDRRAAVNRAVRSIRADIGAEHSLGDLARSALLSPFHFHRIFRQLTDCTPGRFLAAVRMAEAKRRLVFSSASVTDICMDVGYSSLGTFTSQFTRLVGVSPRRFRQIAQGFADRSFNNVLAQLQPDLPRPSRVQFVVSLGAGPGPGSVAVVGLFPSGIPQGFPRACAIGETPGVVEFGDLPDGEYHPLAMSFPPSVTVADAMADEPGGCFVGSCGLPINLVDGRCSPTSRVHIELRPHSDSDPPLLLAVPLLKAAELSYCS